MSNPWAIYDELIGAIPPQVTVKTASAGLRWCRVTSSEGGLGIAYTIDERSRPALHTGATLSGAPLREVAELARSWNFAEAGIGLAAINAWHAHPDRAADNGFVRCAVDPWQHIFDPFADAVTGKVVSVVGHFPFAPAALATAAEVRILERCTQPGDYPDPACEYLVPESDFVFISGSAFVNKTMPRLLDLARAATTVVLGPSTPLSPTLFDHGVDALSGFVATGADALAESLGGLTLTGMFDSGHRVECRRAAPSPIGRAGATASA